MSFYQLFLQALSSLAAVYIFAKLLKSRLGKKESSASNGKTASSCPVLTANNLAVHNKVNSSPDNHGDSTTSRNKHNIRSRKTTIGQSERKN